MSMKQTLFNHNKKPKTPKSPTSPTPTVGDLFQAERPSNYLSDNNLSPTLEKEPQQEEERFGFQPIKKISVLAKVKEKARKWRQNLGRKKQGQDGDPAPSWGAFEDYEKDEYHRRPSKLFTLRRSSKSYKEGTRQRSMSGLSINEKQVLSYSADRGYSEHCEKLKEIVSPNKKLPRLGEEINRLMPDTMTPKQEEPPSYEEIIQEAKEKDITPQNEPEEETADDFESEETDEEAKVMPLDSEETIEEAKELSQICMKLIQAEKGKTPTPSPEEGAFEEEKQQETESPTQMKSLAEAVTEKLAISCPTNSEETQMINSEEEQVLSLPAINTKKEASVSAVDDNDQDYEENGINGKRKWDKGVSVKEYIKNKLEPGEDERALSQVISEAISPRRTPGDKGVVEKVKEAVTLLLLAEQKKMEHGQEQKEKQLEQRKQQKQQQQQQRQQQEREREQEQMSTSQLMRHSSSPIQIPISTNAYEEVELSVEEESHGRILQAN